MKLILVAVAIVGLAAGVLLVLSDSTKLDINPPLKLVGVATPVTVHLANPHGVRRVAAYLEQDGSRYPIFDKATPARRFLCTRRPKPSALRPARIKRPI